MLAQTYPDYELIISDNGSNDSTQEICNYYCKRDSRIRYCRHETNKGLNWNFNFVVQNATGHLMIWFAHDDILEPDFITVSVATVKVSDLFVCKTGTKETVYLNLAKDPIQLIRFLVR